MVLKVLRNAVFASAIVCTFITNTSISYGQTYSKRTPYSFNDKDGKAPRKALEAAGYFKLWKKLDGRIPGGAGPNPGKAGNYGISLLQVESGLPDANKFPTIIGALKTGYKSHATTVASILTSKIERYAPNGENPPRAIYPLGFAGTLKRHQAITASTWNNEILKTKGSTGKYNAILPSYTSNIPKTDIISASYASVGYVGDKNNHEGLRRLDYLLAKNNTLLFSSQPGSYAETNATSSGNVYNGIVVGKPTANYNYVDGTTLDNLNGARMKPDIVAAQMIYNSADVNTGFNGASSYSTPTVATGGAVLLDKAHNTKSLNAATDMRVMKAIIMAGAGKDYLVTPPTKANPVVTDKPGSYTWTNSTSSPLDKHYGAGMFNIYNSYTILEAGKITKGGDFEADANTGWDKASTDGIAGSKNEYKFTLGTSGTFSAILAWNRLVTPNSDANAYDATLADLKIVLTDEDGNQITFSDSKSDNVEHIYIKDLKAGNYILSVDEVGNTGATEYGLAWQTQATDQVPEPTSIAVLLIGGAGLLKRRRKKQN